MTKHCIFLHADTCRLCKRSVTDRNYCEIFSILVREALEAPGGLEKSQRSGSAGGGGGGGLCYVVDRH